MTGDEMPSALDPVDELAEEYLRRRRRGERPTAAEFAARYPEHAARILEFFPALELIEGLKPTAEERPDFSDDGAGGGGPAGGVRLRRLGDYTLLHEIGRGGMGIVYEAEHESLKSRVALKVMHPRFQRRPRLRTPISDRGSVGGQAAPHQYRAGLRLWRAGWSLLLRDAMYCGRRPRAGARGRSPPPRRGQAERRGRRRQRGATDAHRLCHGLAADDHTRPHALQGRFADARTVRSGT